MFIDRRQALPSEFTENLLMTSHAVMVGMAEQDAACHLDTVPPFFNPYKEFTTQHKLPSGNWFTLIAGQTGVCHPSRSISLRQAIQLHRTVSEIIAMGSAVI